MFPLKELKLEMNRLGIHPKKSLGQNFLVNTDIVDRIMSLAASLASSSILEIGPGLGALTRALADLERPLFLMELDAKLAAYWRNQGFKVLQGDALKLDWQALRAPQPILLVSNLPYQIAARLVIDRSIASEGVEHMLLMFQKEVAKRIMAKPSTPDYGLLSVVSQCYWDIHFELEASSKDFYPPPQVASRILSFKRKSPVASGHFLQFLKAAFQQRRKLLVKNLSQIADSGLLKATMERLAISLKARPEELSPETFLRLFLELYP